MGLESYPAPGAEAGEAVHFGDGVRQEPGDGAGGTAAEVEAREAGLALPREVPDGDKVDGCGI